MSKKFIKKASQNSEQKPSLSTTSIMDCQLLRQKVCQIISVMKTNTVVFVVIKTKRELKCQNELFFKYHFSGNTSLYGFITKII